MKVVAWLTVFFFVSLGVQAQDQGSSFMDKMYFAGGGGFGGGTNSAGLRYSYYSVQPTVGYRIQPNFMVGLNVSYSRYNFPDQGVSYEQLGLAPFARYYLDQLFFQAEYNRISSSTIDNQTKRYFDRFLVGIGYTQTIGKRSAINALAMYDLLYQPNGAFLSPFVFRVFFSY